MGPSDPAPIPATPGGDIARWLLGAALLPQTAWAATLSVPGDHADVPSAIAAAEPGDTIEIASGTWSGDLAIDRDLTLRGTDPDVVLTPATLTEGAALLTLSEATVRLEGLTLDAAGIRGIQATNADLTLVDVTVRDGDHPESGGGLDVRGGQARLERVALVDNRSGDGFGGHLAAFDAAVTLVGGRVEGGRAERGGGLYLDGGRLDVTGTAFTRNAARRDDDRGLGGAIATERTTVTLTDATFVDNRVTEGQGGHVSIFRGTATVSGCRFEGVPGRPSATEYFGGGLAVYDAPLVVEDATFVDLSVNHSGLEDTFGFGGAIIVYGAVGATFDIRDSTFRGNRVTAFGGAVRIDAGSGRIAGSTFEDNTADFGGAVHVATDGEVIIEGSTFTGNSARFAGAVRWRPPSSATATSALVLRDNTFVDNVAENYGGVLYGRAGGRLEAHDNVMTASQGTLGGALMVWQVRDVELVRNTFCGNVATGGTAPDGGAVASFRSGSGTYRIANNVFLENAAGAWGGALSLVQDGDVDLEHNTFVGNRSPDGAAVGLRGNGDRRVVLRMHDNLVGWNDGGEAIAGGDVARLDLHHNALWANPGGDVEALLDPDLLDNVTEDPRVQAFTADGDCTTDRPWPTWGSPLVDAADPESIDLDGSRADIGATGGPDADPAFWVDADADDSPVLFDCDDTDEARSPLAGEQPYDGIDQDCDDADLTDVDGDGFDGGEDGPDCDDEDAGISPEAQEIADDGIDQDCDGEDRVTAAPDPPDEGDAGCGCASTSTGGPALLLVGLLLGLRRRHPG